MWISKGVRWLEFDIFLFEVMQENIQRYELTGFCSKFTLLSVLQFTWVAITCSIVVIDYYWYLSELYHWNFWNKMMFRGNKTFTLQRIIHKRVLCCSFHSLRLNMVSICWRFQSSVSTRAAIVYRKGLSKKSWRPTHR